MIPLVAAFAPSGAKDVSFRVEPAQAAEERALSDVVGAIAWQMAYAIWGPFMTTDTERTPWAFVERDGDVLRVDLRTVPAVRAALRRPPLALVIEALCVETMAAEPGALRLKLALPPVFRR